jgi:hypothetical protein
MEPMNKKEILDKHPHAIPAELDEYESLVLKQFEPDGISYEEHLRLMELYQKIFNVTNKNEEFKS